MTASAGLRTGLVAALIAVGVLTAGCTSGTDPSTGASTEMSQQATKNGDGAERNDVDPLVSRIPMLQGITGATWYSGTLGARDAPGPSLYWIDAVVTLPDGVAAELRASLDLARAAGAPDVVTALQPAVPAGDLLTGEELDAAFSTTTWHTTAYLSASGDQVVLVVVGE